MSRRSQLTVPDGFDPSNPETWALLPTSVANARKAEVRFYFTGKPCHHGHISPYSTSGKKCIECSSINSRKRHEANYQPAEIWKADCKQCNKPFTSRKSGTEFCSDQCRWDYRHALEKEERAAAREEKPCIICKKMFLPETKQTVTCSQDCWEIRSKETRNAASKNYVSNNTEKVYETNKKWFKANGEKRDEYTHNRRALHENALVESDPVTTKIKAERFALIEGCCYCGAEEKKTTEHVVSLNKGGLHIPSNILGACGSCNSSKCHRSLEDWFPKQPFYLEERMQLIIQLTRPEGEHFEPKVEL